MEANVLQGDTLGIFSARHGLSREDVIHMNPQLQREGRVFFTEEGIQTAHIYEGETLAVKADLGGFQSIPESDYQAAKSCWNGGGVSDWGEPNSKDGCGTLFVRNGSYFTTDSNGVEHHFSKNWVEDIAFAQKCFQANGYPTLNKSGNPSCFAVEKRNVMGSEVFGVDFDKEIAGIEDSGLPKAQEKECGEVYSKSTIALIWGGLFAGGVAVGKFLL